MAKSVKATISSFKFKSERAKTNVKTAQAKKNAEYQVKQLCTIIDDNFTYIEGLEAKNNELSIKITDCNLSLSKFKKQQLNQENKDKIIKSLKKDINDCQIKLNSLHVKHFDLLIKKDDLDKQIKSSSNILIDKNKTISSLRNIINNNDKLVKGKDELITKYEDNWFVKWFLKK